MLRLLVLVPKGTENNNASLCIATPLFWVCLVFAQKVCVPSFFKVVLGEKKKKSFIRVRPRSVQNYT